MRTTAVLGGLALACAAAAGADTTLEYSVRHGGRDSGAQTTVIGEDGRVRVSYSHRDNGRGPDLEEEMRLAPDGTLKSYRLRGKSTFGAVLDERYAIAGKRARWRSPSESGEATVAGAAIYVPNDASPEAIAILARAALAAPGGRLAALPSGEVAVRRLRQSAVGAAGATTDVALYALTGLGLRPEFVWLEAGPSQRLYARISPGGAHVVAAGHEAVTAELERQQLAEEDALLRAIARRTAHRLAEPVLLRDVRVFDTETAALGEPADVYLQGGRIAAIYPAGSPAQQAGTVVHGEGRALLPGLYDMHSHEDAWNAALQIAGGVTTSRDMGNDNAILAQLIADVDAGLLVGPRIVPAGYIEGESPYASRGGFVARTLDEARAAIDWYAQRGFRQIKIYNSFRPEWVPAAAEYAHARGLKVSGHVPAFSRSERVVREGYDELQHINQVMLNFVSDPDTDSRTLARFTLVGERTAGLDLGSAAVRDYVALLAERGTVVDATLATFEAMYGQRQGEFDPALAAIAEHMPFAVQRDWRRNSMEVTEANVGTYLASYDKMVRFVGLLHAAGVPLVAGTDGIAGFMLHRELELYVRAGLTPGEAIRVATANGARHAGFPEEAGGIARGARADLILVDGDPVGDVSALRRIALVLKEGVAYLPAEIYGEFGIRPFAAPPRIEPPPR